MFPINARWSKPEMCNFQLSISYAKCVGGIRPLRGSDVTAPTGASVACQYTRGKVGSNCEKSFCYTICTRQEWFKIHTQKGSVIKHLQAGNTTSKVRSFYAISSHYFNALANNVIIAWKLRWKTTKQRRLVHRRKGVKWNCRFFVLWDW